MAENFLKTSKPKKSPRIKKAEASADEWRGTHTHSLIGKFFHSIRDGKLEWQGRIVGNPAPDWYMVVLFDWLVGSEDDDGRLVRFADMTEWLFYPTIEAMRFGYEYGTASHFKSKD